MTEALRAWAVAFFFTQLFELPVYFYATRSWRIGFFASAMTHPMVWFVFPRLTELGLGWTPMVLLAEAFAVVAEGLWLRANQVKHPFLWSLAANGFSVCAGLALRHFTGWV